MQRTDRIIMLCLLIGALLLGTFLLPLLLQASESRFLVMFFCGILISEIAVLAIWCALGDQTAAVRLPLAMGLLVGGSCVFTLGLERLTENGEFNPARAMSPILLLSGVVMFTVVQLPAWGARLVLRRRIGLKSAPRSPAAGTFSLFYLLAVTAGAGVLAALLKSTVAFDENSEFWFSQWLAAAMSAGILSAIAVLHCMPCFWLVLSERDSSRAAAALWLFGIWLGIPLALLMVISVLNSGSGPIPGEFVGGLYTFGAGLAGGTLMILSVLRLVGFRLLVVGSDKLLRSDSEPPATILPPRSEAAEAVAEPPAPTG